MDPIHFVARIEPKSKGRGRAVSLRGGGARVITPAATRLWEATFGAIASAYAPATPLDEPLELEVLAVVARPQRLMRLNDPPGLVPATGRPDLDNYVKSIMDALKAWWVDDARVVSIRARKAYAERDGGPRVEVTLRPAPPL